MPRWATGREILYYAATLHGIENPEGRVNEMLEFWDCKSYANRPIDTCSYGMLKRIGLALAVIHDPQVLILDEPFSGLDIFHIKALEEIILERSSRKKLTILSTHVIPYVAELCQRVIVIDRGQAAEVANWSGSHQLERIDSLNRILLNS